MRSVLPRQGVERFTKKARRRAPHTSATGDKDEVGVRLHQPIRPRSERELWWSEEWGKRTGGLRAWLRVDVGRVRRPSRF